MRTFVTVALALALVSGSLHANAEPQRRFNKLVFENHDPNNPLFQFKLDVASCARPMGAEVFVVKPGEVIDRRYYEKFAEDDCMFETRELGWLVTATRSQDNFRWQCRVRIVDRPDPEDWRRVTVETEAVERGSDGAANLCTDGTLVKSAICDTTDVSSFERADCLNESTPLHGPIRITLGGPPMSPSPPELLTNPLATSVSD